MNIRYLTLALLLAVISPAAETLFLDGTWQIIFDRDNSGRAARLHLDDAFSQRPDIREIQVPSCWEEIDKDYEGVAFYRRKLRVPANWQGKTVRLHFDAVNFRAEVWLNDQAVGVHEGGFTPFEFRVEKILKPGEENTLTLRVAGPILLTDKVIEGVGRMETPQWRGAITGGIWQSVRLIATRDAYVEDVFIEPKISDNTATFHVEIENAGTQVRAAQAEITIRPAKQPDKTVANLLESLSLSPGPHRRTWTFEIPNATHWSPDNPHLYRAEVRITYDGQESDLWTTRFGMREFTIRGRTFYLNGKPFYLKATFFEGLYPVKLAYPDSREMAVREIRLAKEAGFNMIRPWRKPPPPMWLDLADEMGVLTVGSLAIECMQMPVESARLPGWVENEVRESVLRDRNRACVVQWELFNELHRPVLIQMLHPMAMLARDLDPTRMILDESGGWAQGANLYLPYESTPTKFNDIHYYPGPQIDDQIYRKLRMIGETEAKQRAAGLTGFFPGRNVLPGLPSYVSELGYGSLPNLVDSNGRFAEISNPITPPAVYHQRLTRQHIRALEESGFDRLYPTLDRFCLDQQRIHGVANKRMIEAVRTNPNVIGYCIHALTGGDWIIGAGLLDLFRNPKTYAYQATKEANQPRILSIRLAPRNIYAERGATLEITSVNDLSPANGQLRVEVVDPNGKVAFTKTTTATAPSGIQQIFREDIDTTNLVGPHTLKATLLAPDGAIIAVNAYSFDVFARSQLVPPNNRIALLDPGNTLKPFLDRAGIPHVDFDPSADPGLPVLVSRTVAASPAIQSKFTALTALVAKGGTAVYLGGVGPDPAHRFEPPVETSTLLPFSYRLKIAKGLWTCVPHIVNDHPIFDGLPVDTMMGPLYENVWTQRTLLGVGGEIIVGSIGFDQRPSDVMRRHYYGPGDTWWGADMLNVPHGRGNMIVSQLRLLENLGKDPVADKVLYNLIRYAGQTSR